MSKEALTFADITDNITDTMGEMEGETIAEIHNSVCSRKIRYVEDSIWEYTDEDDTDT